MRRQTYLVSSSGVHSDGTLTPRPHHNANEHDTRRKLADSAASNCAHLPALASNLQCLLPPLPVVLARRGLLLLAPRAIPKTTSGKLKRAECKQCYARYAEALLRSDVAASRTGVSEGGAVRSDAAAALRPSIDAAALIHAWRSSGDGFQSPVPAPKAGGAASGKRRGGPRVRAGDSETYQYGRVLQAHRTTTIE